MTTHPINVMIEGNIGVGKSTFLEYLKRKYEGNTEVSIVDEPLTKWQDYQGKNLLKLFYDNKEKYGFILQVLLISICFCSDYMWPCTHMLFSLSLS